MSESPMTNEPMRSQPIFSPKYEKMNLKWAVAFEFIFFLSVAIYNHKTPALLPELSLSFLFILVNTLVFAKSAFKVLSNNSWEMIQAKPLLHRFVLSMILGLSMNILTNLKFLLTPLTLSKIIDFYGMGLMWGIIIYVYTIVKGSKY